MSVSVFTAIIEVCERCEGRESEYCLEQIDGTLSALRAAITSLEVKKEAYTNGQEPDLVTCDRHKRVLTSAKRLLDLVEGREPRLAQF
jgi:hypothetical protein